MKRSAIAVAAVVALVFGTVTEGVDAAPRPGGAAGPAPQQRWTAAGTPC